LAASATLAMPISCTEPPLVFSSTTTLPTRSAYQLAPDSYYIDVLGGYSALK
jgi:hypothetical protein